MKNLTTFGKISVTAIIVAIIFGVFKLATKSDIGKNNSSGTSTSLFSKNNKPIKIGVVTWGGYVGGQYFNEGFEASDESRFAKEYGFQVEFKVIDDFDASRAAFKSGEIDLLWATIDAFPTEVDALKEFEPQVVFQADWSRGGDAIVVRRGINNVADLKGKKIAVAPMTPSNTFLLWMLDASNLKASDVQIVEVPNAIDAASTFKAGRVDAAVVWSPDDESCLQSVAGSKILVNTKNASKIIADVFIAKKSFVEKNKDKLAKLYEGWMIGAAEINASQSNKNKAADILAKGLGIPKPDALKAIDNVRLCTHGDNLRFYGLDKDYKGVTGEELYGKMSDVYNKLGMAPTNVPSWRIIANTSAIQAFSKTGDEHLAEEAKKFSAPTESLKTTEATSSKQVTISFRTGEFNLDENAKYIIDKEFVDLAKAFDNARIRIEGNTDNVGSEQMNKELSLKRANAVANYLSIQYNMPLNRFIVVGNGSSKPVAENTTEDGRSKNRRTEFQFINE